MIIPIRCFTCNHVLADKWKWFERECEKLTHNQVEEEATTSKKEAKNKESNKKNRAEAPPAKNMEIANRAELLDKLGLRRLCCRRHMLGHVDMMELI